MTDRQRFGSLGCLLHEMSSFVVQSLFSWGLQEGRDRHKLKVKTL
jgi:hypothetical protein